MRLSAALAGALLQAADAHARSSGLRPLGIVVLGPDESVRAALLQDGATGLRFEIARAKAAGALKMGRSSREIEKLALERPAFFQSLSALCAGRLVPAAGGVLLADAANHMLGAIGVSGDTSDNDELCALEALRRESLAAWCA